MKTLDCNQMPCSDEQLDSDLFGSLVRITKAADMCAQSINEVEPRESIEADGTTVAASEQEFRFEDSMEANGWEWTELLNFSPLNDQAPLGIGS